MNIKIYNAAPYLKVRAFGKRYVVQPDPDSSPDNRFVLVKGEDGITCRIKDEHLEISPEDNPFLFKSRTYGYFNGYSKLQTKD